MNPFLRTQARAQPGAAGTHEHTRGDVTVSEPGVLSAESALLQEVKLVSYSSPLCWLMRNRAAAAAAAGVGAAAGTGFIRVVLVTAPFSAAKLTVVT